MKIQCISVLLAQFFYFISKEVEYIREQECRTYCEQLAVLRKCGCQSQDRLYIVAEGVSSDICVEAEEREY